MTEDKPKPKRIKIIGKVFLVLLVFFIGRWSCDSCAFVEGTLTCDFYDGRMQE